MEGQGIVTYKTGKSVQGNWVNGQLEGQAKVTKEDRSVRIGIYKKGQCIKVTTEDNVTVHDEVLTPISIGSSGDGN